MGLLELFGHKYPDTNFHELNLDWCITAILDMQTAWAGFSAGNKLIFANPLQHDLTKTYAKNTIVVDSVSGTAYLSLGAVPVGVQLTNADYWLPVFDFAGYVTRANQNFTDNYFSGTDRAPYALAVDDWVVLDDVLYKVAVAMAADDLFIIGTNIIHFTVEQFLKDFIVTVNQTLNNYSLTIQQYKNDIDASELAYRQQLAQDIADTTATLQAQLNAAISGATVDSEVINARVGFDNTTYNTLRDAIVGQIMQTVHASYISLNDATKWADYNNDMNDLPLNAIIQVTYNTGISNLPYATFAGNVLTYDHTIANSANTRVQVAVGGQSRVFFRLRYGNDWRAWREMASADDLANALSAYTTELGDATAWSAFSNDADNLTPNKVYQITYNTGVSNLPISNFKGSLFSYDYRVTASSSCRVQIAIYGTGAMYVRSRYSTVWGSWHTVAYTTDLDIAVRATNLSLSNASAWAAYNSDFDDLPLNVIAQVTYNTGVSNLPYPTFTGNVMTYDHRVDSGANTRVQIAVGGQTRVFFRLKYGNDWRAWRELVNTDMLNISEDYKGLTSILAVGDSLTKSLSYPIAGTPVTVKSWAKIIADDANASYTSLAYGGAKTSDILNDANYPTIVADTSEAVFLMLGVNDSNGQATPLGTTASVGTNDGTFYANYAKIVNDLSENHKVIFCIVIPATVGGSYLADYNTAITYVANYYPKAFPVDLRSCSDQIAVFKVNGHLSSIGYAKFAQFVKQALCEVMETEATFFTVNIDS